MSSSSPRKTEGNPENVTNGANYYKNCVAVVDGPEAGIPVDPPRDDSSSSAQCKVYSYRWVVLFLFASFSMINAFHWIQFSIITGIIVQFYGVSEEMVDMTSVIYMITYVPLVFPASFFLEKKGLRLSVIMGSLGTALGSGIKVFATSPSHFYLAFTGQTIVAVSQTFILGIPPLLAAVWFGPDQVSTATSIGVLGNQLGVAAGFLLPPLLVRNGTAESVEGDLRIMFVGTAAVSGALLLAVVLFFREKPPSPPSKSQMALGEELEKEPSFLRSMKSMLTNPSFLLLLLSYGMNVGVFCSISTLLSSFIENYFPDNGEDAGRIGVLAVVSGMIGSVVAGLILDTTKRYKETTLVLYFLSFVGMVGYTFVLPYGGHIVYMYVVFFALGFFMTGYLPVGFEFAAELTYPESEGTSAGLLNMSAHVFGFIFTPVTRLLFKSWAGDIGANLAQAGILLLGFVMTAAIRADLRRTDAQNGKKSPLTHGAPPPVSDGGGGIVNGGVQLED